MSAHAAPRQPEYNWTRFWVPHTGTVELSDFGFLMDPEAGPFAIVATDAKPLPDLAPIRALALLGEMGIGKSTTLKAEAARITAAADPEVVSIYVDLRAYGSETVLLQKVFGSPAYLAWKENNKRLVLHLDSLDEALLRVETVANLLAAELKEQPTDRMSIRIACRTAVWPSSTLGAAFAEIWGPEQTGVFELAPLRRKDVIAAVEANGVDAEAFMKAVLTASATPFAIKPLTLNLLIGLFQKDGQLPDSTAALYIRGCLKLCEEQNPSRRETGRRGRLDFKQRFRLASRIAAATMLANKFAVWTGPEADGVPNELIPVSALIGGQEEGDFPTFTVTHGEVLEVLDTGLFSARGDHLMGWAHQGYAEFLAAGYLIDRNVDPATILKILRHPEGGLVPQLATVAAWATSLNADLRAPLLVAEPLALLAADLTGWQDAERADLTRSLLEGFGQGRINDNIIGLSFLYAKLKHPDLAVILRPYIADKGRHYVARRNALLIARACATTELQPDLMKLAFDETEEHSLRSRAVLALAHCGDATVPAAVMPLALGNTGNDPTCDIRGAALEMVWPKHLSGTDMFAQLSSPNEGHFGLYTHFLNDLPETLKPEDLAPALRWATEFVRGLTAWSHAFTMSRLADAILFLAWDQMERDDVMPALLDNIRARLFQHGNLCRGSDYDAIKAFQVKLATDAERRRCFLRALATTELEEIDCFSYGRSGLVTKGDFTWLLSLAPGGTAHDPALNEKTVLNLAATVMDWSITAHGDAFYDAAMAWAALHTRYAGVFTTMMPDCEDAQRHHYWKEQYRALEQDQPPPIDPHPEQRVLARLEKFEAGDLGAWWGLNLDLSLTPTSMQYAWDLEYHINTMHGWETADAPLRQRILSAAERYLRQAESSAGEWIGTNQVWRPDWAAWRALILLHDEAPAVYDALPTSIWEKWAPTIVGVPKNVGTEHPKSHIAVYRDAYTKAPAAFIATVRSILAKERAKEGPTEGRPVADLTFAILRELPEAEDLSAIMDGGFEELKDSKNTPEQFSALLEALLTHNHAAARDYAVAVLAGDRPEPIKMIAAQRLARRCAAQVWLALWAFITADENRARTLLLEVAGHYHFDTPFYAGVPEAQLADLYILLTRLFPRADDPEHPSGRAHAVGPMDSIARIRDTVPAYLSNRGSREAVASLRACAAALPQFDWLLFEVAKAEQVMRIRTWAPLTLKELFGVTDRAGSQLITTPEELRDLILTVLKDFGEYLHGEQRPIKGLWDWQAATKTWRPKDENAFSDIVKLFLEQALKERGIIANREVEISHAPGSPVGTRTDIRIDAIRKGPDGRGFDVITAIIESKGAWNPDLMTNLTSQLYGTYMVTVQAPVGIYLVAWFDTDGWDPTDHRRRKVPKRPVADVQAQLTAEAAALPKTALVTAVILSCQKP